MGPSARGARSRRAAAATGRPSRSPRHGRPPGPRRGRRWRANPSASIARRSRSARYAPMDWTAFRAEFPVLDRLAYMNAGTDGPVPRRGHDAAAARLREELEGGRSGKQYFEGLGALAARLRERLAGFLGCDADEVALTRSTTDGVSTALSALCDVGP